MSSFQPTGESWRPPGQTGRPRASFLRRTGAALIDIVILLILWAIIQSALHVAGDLLFTPFLIAYFTLLEGRPAGQSIGKKVCAIQVRSAEDGQAIGYRRALIRSLVRIPSYLALGLGYIWALLNSDRQGWHDLAAKTVVMPAISEPQAGGVPW